MFNWAKQQLANVAGTQEPIYGPSALQSVETQTKETPYTEITKEALKWTVMESTCVETQTFYMMTDSGHLAMAQVIYSNVMGVRTTSQFNGKIFSADGKTPHLWSSTPLENYGFDVDKYSFFADGVSVELSAEGDSYTIKSAVDEDCMVDIKFTRAAPGFVAGKDGTSHYGTDAQNPWGSMRHVFWPRCSVEGKFITKSGEANMGGKGLFVHALQGMKPHHAAARWNFINFQSADYSAVLMQFTTPASYGSSIVNVGGIVKGSELVFAGTSCSATATEVKGDPDNDWPEPGTVAYHWEGKTKDGQDATFDIAGSLGTRIDRVDVMAEVPGFVKTIVASAVGTKPYIYQYSPKLTLKGKVGSTEVEQEGTIFSEATFIS